jgi:hypothetical protein
MSNEDNTSTLTRNFLRVAMSLLLLAMGVGFFLVLVAPFFW